MNELLNFKWNESENFKIISKNYNELNNDLKNVINFSKEYVKILISFKQQASDLYTSYLFDYSKNKKSFCSNIIKSFSKLIYAQIESFKTLIEGLTLRNDIINQSINEKEIIYKRINEQINNSIKDLESNYSNMKRTRESFEKIANEKEDIILRYYESKKKEERNAGKDLMNDEFEILNDEEVLESALLKIKQSENEYKKNYSIELQYEETTLSTFKATNKSLIILCKDYAQMIYDIIIEYFVHYRSLKSLIESEINSISYLNDLDIEGNLNKKIKNELVHCFPYEKTKIKPYKIKLIKKINYSNDLYKKIEELGVQDMYEIVQKIYQYLSIKDDEFDLNIEKEKYLTNNIVNKIFNFSNKTLYIPDETDEDIKNLNELLKKKHNRYIFLIKLNFLRNLSIFLIPEKKFNVIGNFLYSVYDNILKDNDLFSAKLALILSQTYYLIDKNNNKIYLQNIIQHNPIFKKIGFWDSFLQYCIENEITESVKKDFQNEMINLKYQEQKDIKYNNIIFTQLITISNHMIEFNVDKEDIKKLINEKIEKYQISEESKNIIINLIENNK